MHIHFISTLTPEDEDRLAVVIEETVKALLSTLPLSYKLRIETAGRRRYEHEHIGARSPNLGQLRT
jgi:hypothetical protein